MTQVTRRGWIVLALVGVLAFFGGVGLFKLLVRDDAPDRVTADGTESPSPTIEPTAATLTPTPSATTAPTSTPTTTPAATLTPTPSATTAPKPTASKTTSPTPTPKPTTMSPTPKPTTKSPTPTPSAACTPSTTVLCVWDNYFDDSSMTIPRGTPITIRNVGKARHTWTSDGGTENYDVDLAPGASTTYTFNVPGVYDYLCKPHQTQGMTGRITVT